MDNVERPQKMETEPTYTQKILPTPSKATKQRQKPNTAFRKNHGNKRLATRSETPSQSLIIGGRTKLNSSSFGQTRYPPYDSFSQPDFVKTGTQSSQQTSQQ